MESSLWWGVLNMQEDEYYLPWICHNKLKINVFKMNCLLNVKKICNIEFLH